MGDSVDLRALLTSPAAVALSVGNRDITDYRLPDSSDSFTAAEMESDSDYTVVQSRHLKRKLRRTSTGCDSTHKSRCDERVFSVGYTPTTAGTNLNSLNRQSLTKFFDRIASGHVKEIRINARKNILTVDVSSQAVLEPLKAIQVVGNIPVRSFLAYGNDTCTGVVSDVGIDIKDEDLRSVLSSTHRIDLLHDTLPYSRSPYQYAAEDRQFLQTQVKKLPCQGSISEHG
ncbi:hypothetical protein HPB49_005677 [Dermacentor silvarum]|uniref:Uncharacterized protein n=1 Tax=Dermacentor silvarum TaxID=543639 RepID=A0ACB8C7H2_DERSI|nr:hypothetical protein HPB49_005677 [Dermacentor silvarum]